jgi:hypothetical protein
MANNVQAEAVVSAGSRFATAEVTLYGDASTHVPACYVGIVSGSEGAQTFTEYVGGAGAVTAGTQRMTLASDDPAVTALQIMDDWDESDRAKVNLIVGQAGIAAGAGAVGVTVPRVTLASDDPGVALLTTIDADTGSILTSVQLIDNLVLAEDAAHASGDPGIQLLAVRKASPANLSGADGDYEPLQISGGRLYVDASGTSITVINAGTFAVQVDGAALTSLQLIDNLVLAEDAAHNSGDPGVQVLAVRKDSGAALAGTDGDYTPLQTDSSGNLRVAIAAGGGSGGTAMTDDAAFTAATTSFTPVGGIVTADSVDSGDGGAFAMLANRQQKVTLYDSSGVELAVGGGTQYDEDAAHSSGSKVTGCGIVRKDTAASLAGTDGDYTLPIADANGKLWVNCSGETLTVGSHAVTNAGTFAVQTGAERAEDAAHSTGHTGLFILAVRSDTAASTAGTDGDYTALITDSAGKLHVNVGNTVTVASHAVTNAGTFAVQVDGSALTALQKIDDPVLVDDAAFTPATSSVMMAGFEADESSTDSVDEGDAGAARMTLDRKLIVTPQPHTTGGCSIFRTLDLDETEEDVKTAAGNVYGIYAFNTTNAILWLKFYNATAANVTVGTTTPVMTLGVPGNNDTDGAGFVIPFPVGIAFDTAICVAATTGVADNDTGAPGANALIVQVFYK